MTYSVTRNPDGSCSVFEGSTLLSNFHYDDPTSNQICAMQYAARYIATANGQTLYLFEEGEE